MVCTPAKTTSQNNRGCPSFAAAGSLHPASLVAGSVTAHTPTKFRFRDRAHPGYVIPRVREKPNRERAASVLDELRRSKCRDRLSAESSRNPTFGHVMGTVVAGWG